jgi:hypothetical protein
MDKFSIIFTLVKPNVNTKMETLMDRKRRSESLTKDEVRAFNKYLGTFPTKVDAAFALGVSRTTLHALTFKGSGKPETIAVIREKLAAFELSRA